MDRVRDGRHCHRDRSAYTLTMTKEARLLRLRAILYLVFGLVTTGPAQGAGTVQDIPDPDAYTCSRPAFISFESLPDDTNLSAGAIAGVQFTTTDGFTWRVGDFATGQYNGKYPGGEYTSHGTHWAWLGPEHGVGRIDFVSGPASFISLLVSSNTVVTLEAYSAMDTLLDIAGPIQPNGNTGHMTEVRISRSVRDIAYVIVHDAGNFFLIDALCTDASGATESQISLNPSLLTKIAGVEVTLIAQVRSGAPPFDPIAKVPVTFTVILGPNIGLMRTVSTDSFGIATFTYTSDRSGTDEVVAEMVDSVSGTPAISNIARVQWAIKVAYYALGDSIAAGHGLPSGDGQRLCSGYPCVCRRSPDAYPNIVAKGLRGSPENYILVRASSLACSGARTFTEVDSERLDLPEQVAAVLQNHFPQDLYTIVSVTVGVDDFSFSTEALLGTHWCLERRDFEGWVNGIVRAAKQNIASELGRLAQNIPKLVIVLTDYYNPLNRQSAYFAVLKNDANWFARKNENCKRLTDQELYDRAEFAIQKLNAALRDIVVSLPLKRGQHSKFVSFHESFLGHEAARPNCGKARPVEDLTLVQYARFDIALELSDAVYWYYWRLTQQYGRDYLLAHAFWVGKKLLKGDDCFHLNAQGQAAYAMGINSDAPGVLDAVKELLDSN